MFNGVPIRFWKGDFLMKSGGRHMSLPKSILTDYLGSLSEEKIQALNEALRIALDLEN